MADLANEDMADLIMRKFNKNADQPISTREFIISSPPKISNVAEKINRHYNQNLSSEIVPRLPIPEYLQPLQTSDVADIINSKFNRNPFGTEANFEVKARCVGLPRIQYMHGIPLCNFSHNQVPMPMQPLIQQSQLNSTWQVASPASLLPPVTTFCEIPSSVTFPNQVISHVEIPTLS